MDRQLPELGRSKTVKSRRGAALFTGCALKQIDGMVFVFTRPGDCANSSTHLHSTGNSLPFSVNEASLIAHNCAEKSDG